MTGHANSVLQSRESVWAGSSRQKGKRQGEKRSSVRLEGELVAGAGFEPATFGL